jgi:hypothetical protein
MQGDEPPQWVAAVGAAPFGPPVGLLSSDEEWIAYIIGDQPTPGFELHLLRSDGSSDEVIAMTGIHSDCTPGFAWLKSDATLIYNVGTIGFHAYETATASMRLVVPQESAGYLLGIDEQDQILMAVLEQPGQPHNIVAADTATGAQTILAPMPQSATLFCSKLSPDGNHLLFSMGNSPYGTYLFERATRQSREIDIVPNPVFWAQDGKHVLDTPARWGASLSVLAITEEDAIRVAHTRLQLPGEPATAGAFAVSSTSPDGQWIVGCQTQGTPDQPSDQRAWLYHLPTQTWQQLAHGCVRVVGWPTR